MDRSDRSRLSSESLAGNSFRSNAPSETFDFPDVDDNFFNTDSADVWGDDRPKATGSKKLAIGRRHSTCSAAISIDRKSLSRKTFADSKNKHSSMKCFVQRKSENLGDTSGTENHSRASFSGDEEMSIRDLGPGSISTFHSGSLDSDFESKDDADASLGDFVVDPDTLSWDAGVNNETDPQKRGAHHGSFSETTKQQRTKTTMHQSMSALPGQFSTNGTSFLGTQQPFSSSNTSMSLYSSQCWLDDSETSDNAPFSEDSDKLGFESKAKEKRKKPKKKTLPKNKSLSGTDFARVTKERKSKSRDSTRKKRASDDETATVETTPMSPTSGQSNPPSTHARQSCQSNGHSKNLNSRRRRSSSCSIESFSSFSSVTEIKPDNRLSKIVLNHMKKMIDESDKAESKRKN